MATAVLPVPRPARLHLVRPLDGGGEVVALPLPSDPPSPTPAAPALALRRAA